MEENKQELGLDFERGVVLRGEETLMTLEELLFLLDSANRYNSMFPVPQSQEFMGDLRDRIECGFTAEQFAEIKQMMAGEETEV